MSECPKCGLPVAAVDDVVAGRATYADSPGGHADRHTLVVEAAEAVIAPTNPSTRAAHLPG